MAGLFQQLANVAPAPAPTASPRPSSGALYWKQWQVFAFPRLRPAVLLQMPRHASIAFTKYFTPASARQWQQTLRRLEYSGPLMIEMWSESAGDPLEEIRQARSWLLQKMQVAEYLTE